MSPTTSSEPGAALSNARGVARLSEVFERARREGRAALIPYITAGHPAPDATAPLLDALVAAGADIIELGVPFSDPVADGPTIQRSSQLALDAGITLQWTLDALANFRTRHDAPVVLFTYLNPVLNHGVDRFLRDASSAGADGVLLTDLPVGADPELERRFDESDLALIRLVAPTTTRARASAIARHARGFLYYIARMGVTGATPTLRGDLPERVRQLREASPVPVAVGFGISTPDHAAEVGKAADGVVVGSALVDALDRGGVAAGADLIASLRSALDRK